MTFALLLQPAVADTLDEPVEPTTPVAPGAAGAAPKAAACAAARHDVPIASELGSAGIMYNIAEHPESIRAVAGRLLNEALTRQKKADPAVKCDACEGDAKPRIVYRVAPVHLLADKDQDPVCRNLDAETAKRPLEFPARHFGSIPELNDWMMAFSQGRGDEGKQLYAQCAGNCSPRYQFVIAPVDDGLEVETRVQCGLARDRSSDDYEVSTALRIDCNAATKPVAANIP
jgi:hypothetical protein